MKKSLSYVVFVSFALVLGDLRSGGGQTVPTDVTICHFPPGNPANAKVITVGASAVPAHVNNHNDAVCLAGDSDCCFGRSQPSVCTDFQTDLNNCGSCGNICPVGDSCSDGSCVASAPTNTPTRTRTPTLTRTATPTFTRTATRSATPTAATLVACGNGLKEGDEDCDDGGTCIGGSNAGTHCTAESQCQGNGVCIGGSKAETACAGASDCPGGNCVHCVPQGGDGCAANCTTETAIVANLLDGQLSGGALVPGTSGAVVYNEILGPIALPFAGAGETVVVGKARDGIIPAVVPAASVHFPAIDVSGLACACVRGVAAKTCGGMLFNADGSAATDCTPGYTAGDSLCTGGLPCTFVHGQGTGAGNSASGIISCNAGLQGVNLMFAEDSNGSADPPRCNPSDPSWVPGLTFPECGDPPVITLYGAGPAGSAALLNTTAIGQAVGSCANTANLPPNFCTDQEGFSTRGTPVTVPSVTGTAAGVMFNINQTDDDTLCNCPMGLNSCPSSDCVVDATHPGVCSVTLSRLCTQNSDCPSGETCAGALSIVGTSLPVCTDQLTSVSGMGLAGAFTSLSNATIGDIVVTNLLKVQ